MNTLSERIERLERSNRRWKLGLAAVVLAGAAFGAIESQNPPRNMNALVVGELTADQIVVKKELQLHDTDGNVVAKLTAKDSGSPLFLIQSPDGEQSIGMLCNDGLAFMRLKGAFKPDGVPEILFIADDRKAAVTVISGGKGMAEMVADGDVGRIFINEPPDPGDDQ